MHTRIDELLDYLDEQRKVLRSALESVDPVLRERQPSPDRWSAAGVIEHLAIVERRIAQRVAVRVDQARSEGCALETRSEPVLPGLNTAAVLDRRRRVQTSEAGQPTGLSADAAWTALEQAGDGVRELLRHCDGLDLGTLFLPHPILGEMSLYAWFAFVGAHEARHAAQIRALADALTEQGLRIEG